MVLTGLLIENERVKMTWNSLNMITSSGAKVAS